MTKKSVERVKPKRTKPEITQKDNTNANAQIVQVIFPPDTELRKVRKKRKGPSAATRKKQKERDELLETLKSKLNEYDQLQVQAQQASIKIPAEIGVAVINKSDLKTNEDIQNYINDVSRKISLLQQLIEKAQTPAQMGLPLRLGSGVAPMIPTLPAFPLQPRLIPPQPIPVQPQPIPVQPQPQPQSEPDQTRQTLDRLATEIKDKLKERGETYQEPEITITQDQEFLTPRSQPDEPQQLLKEGDLILNKGVLVGNKELDIQAPKGWYEQYEPFRRYINNVMNDTFRNKRMDGVFHIPLETVNILYRDRDEIKEEYEQWFSSLPDDQKEFILNPQNQPVNQVHIELLSDVELNPEELAKKLLSQNRIGFTEITAGNQRPAYEIRVQQGGSNPFKSDEDNKAYQEYMKQYATVTNELISIEQELQRMEQAQADPSPDRLKALRKQINDLDSTMQQLYLSLPDDVKLAVGTEQDKIRGRMYRERIDIDNVSEPPQAPIRRPKRATVTNEEEAIKRLRFYVSNSSTKVVDGVYDAIDILFGNEFRNMVKSKKSAAEKRAIITKNFNSYLENQNTPLPPGTF
jgi:hypothetical protein